MAQGRQRPARRVLLAHPVPVAMGGVAELRSSVVSTPPEGQTRAQDDGAHRQLARGQSGGSHSPPPTRSTHNTARPVVWWAAAWARSALAALSWMVGSLPSEARP